MNWLESESLEIDLIPIPYLIEQEWLFEKWEEA